MVLINSQFLKLAHGDVRVKMDAKLSLFRSSNPRANLIELDSGDVILPLAPCVVKAMVKSVEEMGDESTFRGRSPIGGYDFLIDAIVKFNHKNKKLNISKQEIFINDGTKDDLTGLSDILCKDNHIAVVDPMSQTFIEASVIANRGGELKDGRWSHIVYLDCLEENGFLPKFPKLRPDVIYLSSPNDATGTVMTREVLEKWVKYALENDSLILFDATYEWFISDDSIPHSIYEIKGAKKCAIEFRSFSKSAGFTGLRCGYTIIPKEIKGYSLTEEKEESLSKLWRIRKEIKSYAPPYMVQRGAAAMYTPEGIESLKTNIKYYMENARMLREALTKCGLKYTGGINSPFIWVESPYGSSWKLFDKLLTECDIVCSPGEKYGASGKGYVRLSAFANQSKVMMASVRISGLLI